MARRSDSWRDRRRAPQHREHFSEDDVEVLRRDGLLSKVVRLPFPAGVPSLDLPPPLRIGLTTWSEASATSAPVPAAPRDAHRTDGAHDAHRAHDLCLPDGTRARVTSEGLIVGRRRLAAADQEVSTTARLELTDESRSLSREHARLVVDAHGVVTITDLGSGNGTTVRQLRGAMVELAPGAPLTLSIGDVVHLGGTTASLQEARPSS
ncbi:FHA domain-containing protein [Frigoribacterium sp. ACAM 257]|uniref:FHA domain-containing protein n=1 Tax=Frigoribacterium sp. ACAM 257 TaxID=2508998 RepID=UPI0011BA1579|nr:FHA domain-containing protein [Frigoribacterium sp. ACAM 257]TWX38699.1 FHA domain-containing protein [Frigoribacterium sp. ACAM 257]